MSLAFARLALRRALPPGLALAAAALAAVFVASTWKPDGGAAEALAGTLDTRAAANALARQGVWTALLISVAPFFLARAAGALPAWRRGELDWLLASARSRAALVLSAYSGQLAAALALALLFAGAAELATGPTQAGRALTARFAVAGRTLGPENDELIRRVDTGTTPSGAALRVRLLLMGGGPAADVRLALRRSEPPASSTALRARLAGPRTLELVLPPGEGPLDVALARLSGDALVGLAENGIELVVPTRSERVVGLRIALRVWLALAAALALALGLGAWLSAPTAIAGVLALAVLALGTDVPELALLPWGTLPAALELAGEGVAAPWPSPRSQLATLATVLVGLGLAAWGLRGWRRAP